MVGYFGTEQQIELQRKTYEDRRLIADTPGLYNAGRFVGSDDPDILGWDRLDRMLRDNGVLGLRMVAPDQGRRYFPRLIAAGCRIDVWDVLTADAAIVRPKVAAILARSLPEGLRESAPLREAAGADTVAVQRFLAGNGMAPFPGAMLIEGADRATVVVTDRDEAPVAVAHAYFPHNRHSRHHRNAWIGLVATDPDRRGAGLGRYVNARAIQRAIDDLGATHVYELVSPGNEPSRRMVESCGPSIDPNLVCGVAVPVDAARFTR